jgi:hypothetical protein
VALAALIGGAAVWPVAGTVAAEQRYDRRLEEAAMAIVAARIGDIRGGFAFDGRPVMVVLPEGHADDARMAATERLPDGLQRAIERPAAPGAMF